MLVSLVLADVPPAHPPRQFHVRQTTLVSQSVQPMAESVSLDLQACTVRRRLSVPIEYRAMPAAFRSQDASDLTDADEFGKKRERGLPGIELVLKNHTERLRQHLDPALRGAQDF